MKARQIEKVISEKIAALAKDHPAIQDDLLKNSIVTGGCIASMFLKEKVNDFDLYFSNIGALARVINYFGKLTDAQFLVAYTAGTKIPTDGLLRCLRGTGHWGKVEGEQFVEEEVDEEDDETAVTLPASNDTTWFALYSDVTALQDCENIAYIALYYKSCGFWTAGEHKKKEDDDKKSHVIKFASANAVTLSDKVQLVFRFYGPPEEIHKNYDFVHATNYWTLAGGLVTHAEALEAILARELIYKGSRFPLASIFRTRKFIHRGWTMHIGHYVKMAMQLNEFDLRDIHTLREQLTGVDAAYLNMLITKAEKHNEPITCSWVCELVDAIIAGGNFDADENEAKEMNADEDNNVPY